MIIWKPSASVRLRAMADHQVLLWSSGVWDGSAEAALIQESQSFVCLFARAVIGTVITGWETSPRLCCCSALD